ncbi:MAG: filamentous hemagglutinin N-terminal domain-containing protein, partial [Rhabdochlamydiaceae bacterium]|nr:filamentous hemagglutinin N-terminal domain-containing protein [Rhabdochlamydiaceae bacterium]
MQPRLLQFLLATPLCLSAHLFSSDFQVISGSASSTQTGNLTTIENSPHAILHWNDFSIPEQNHLHFAQVSAASTVLNRVTGNNMSALLGTLSSNGQVYLINPNGILIGPHAEVLTAGFLASTANLSDEQFLASKELLFSFPGEGTIVNQGSIQCGDGNLFLIARDVINQGECAAGFIGIGSAVEVLIQPQGAQRIYIRPDPIHVGEVINEGTLEALAIEMKTSSHYEKGIRIEGPHGELKLTTEGGRIILSAEEGGVQLEGSLSAPGGEVHVLGQSIFLGSTSSIDVSGATGGGTVLIGGDYQGANAQIPNAQSVIMENGAQIHADALLLGDGGKVILWADDTTWFDGQISAKGGAQGGSGGFVETSGKLSLSVQTGFVNTSAPLGNYGSWLLDPASIVVQTGGVDAIDPVCASASTLTIDPATLAAAVTDVILCAQNAAGSSVTVNSPIVMTANAGINLTLTAGSGNAGPLALNANITTAGGSVTCNGVATLGTTVQIDTTNGGLSAGAAISFNSTINATTAGVEGLTLNAGSGFISLAGIIGGGTRLGALSLTSTHATGVTIGNSITASAFTTVAPTKMVLSLAGTTTISTAAANGALFCGGAINGTTTGAQSLILTAGSGLITLSGAVGTGTKLGTFNVTTTNATGAIIQDDITSNSFAATGATNVQLFKSGTTTISTTGTVSIGGTLNGTVSGAQALSINSPGSIVTFTQTIGNSIPLASLSASGSTIIQSSSNITTGAVSYTGTSLITLAGNITTTSGALTFTGVVSLGNTTNRTFDTTNGTLSSGADIFFSNNFNASSLTATQLVTIRAGSGTVTFTGGIGASNSWGMLNVTGATIIQSSAATTQKSLSYTATTGISLAGDINISASTPASISINGPTTFTGNRTFTSTSGAVASTISFSGSLDGSGTLSMFAGVGSVTLNATIGANTPPANLTFTGSTLSARIGSDITVSGANPLTFSPQVTFLAGSSTITTNNAALTFSNLVNGFNNGVGNATLKSGTATTTFLNTVGGSIYLGNLSVESSNATGLLLNTSANVIRALSFTTKNATTMQLGVAGTTTITAFGTGTGIALGGAVVGTSASAQALSLQGGSGTITVSNNIGTVAIPLSTITLNTTNTTTNAITLGGTAYPTSGAQSYTAGTAGLMNVSGTVGFTTTNSPITFSTGTLTPASSSVVTLTAGSGAISISPVNGDATTTLNFSNTGTLTTTGGAGTGVTIGTLNFNTNPSSISLGGNVTTLTSSLTFPVAVTLTADSIVTTTNQPLQFNSTINGARNLTLASGSSTITLSTSLTTAPLLSSLTLNSSNTGTTAINLNGTTYSTTGLQSYTAGANGQINVSGVVGFNTTNSAITFSTGTLTPAAASVVTLTAGSGAISVGPVNGNNTTTLHYVNTGTAATTGPITIGTLDFTAPSTISIGNNITSLTGALTFPSATILTATSTIDTSTNNTAIVFSSTVNGTVAGAQGLTLTPGSGSATFSGIVGGSTRPADISVTSSNATGLILNTSAITAKSLTTTGSTTTRLSFAGNTTVNTNSTGTGISFGGAISGTAANTQGLILQAGSGTVNIGNNAGTIAVPLATFTITTTNTTTNAITFGGTTYQTSGAQSYTSGAASQINVSGTVGFTTSNNPITFSTGTLSLAPASVVTLTAGSGAISVGPASGDATTTLHFINTGTVTTTGAITVGTLDFTSPTGISIGNNITALTSSLSFPAAVTLTGNSIITTTNQPISFSSTINGAQTLSLTPGSGIITLSGSVGNTTALTSLALTTTSTSANAITFGGTLYRTTGSQNYTTGIAGLINVSGTVGFTTTLNGPITFATGTLTPAAASSVTLTSGSGAISVGPVNGGATTALHFVNTGTVTTNSTVTIGTLDFTAPSSISLGGNVTALTSALTFPSAVTLTTDAIVTTTNQPLQFSSTINGAHNLSLASGSGTITLSTSLATAPILTSLTLNSSNTGATAINLNGTTYTTTGLQSYTAGAGGQINVSGTVGFNTTNSPITFATGTLTPAAASVVTLTSGSGAISVGPVNGGATTALHFVNTGTVTTTGAITIGTLDFTAPSSISLGGNVTALTSALTFPSAVTLTTDAIVTTTNQPLQFSSTINGAHNLSLASGSGTITLSTSLATAPILTSLTLNSSNTGATAINLNGTAYTTTGSQSYTAGVGGQINVSGTVGFNTTNSPITFATGTLTPAAASVVTLTAGSGAISVGPVNGDATTTLHFVNTGTVTTTGAITIGTLDFTAPSSISIGGNITVLTSNLNFP